MGPEPREKVEQIDHAVPSGTPPPSIPPTVPLAEKLTSSPAESDIPVSVQGSGPGTETDAGSVVADAWVAGRTIKVRPASDIIIAIASRTARSLSGVLISTSRFLTRVDKFPATVPPMGPRDPQSH
jgi:hypothetical protein